jgi:hypothetical protein
LAKVGLWLKPAEWYGCTEADNETAVAIEGEQPAEVVAAMQKMSCESFEQNFAELIEDSRDCNTDTDCVVTEFGCPLVARTR